MSINTRSDENVAPDLHSVVNKFKELPENDQLELIEEASREVQQEVTTIEKLPEESEKDFRVRRFTELFHNLPLDFLLSLWSKARDKPIPHPEPIFSTEETQASEIIHIPESGEPIIPRDATVEVSFRSYLFKVRTPDLGHGRAEEEEDGKNKL